MIFNYECECGWRGQRNIKFGSRPTGWIPCEACGSEAHRVWESPQIVCDNDPDHVPPQFAVSRDGAPVSSREAAKREKQYERGIQQRRQELKGTKAKGGIQQTHSIPPELYYGKVRQSGDKNYWKDPKNLRKHSSTKVT